jgi:arylsulfatase
MVAAMTPTRLLGQPDRSERPNFLLIVADDMGFSDAGCYGGEITTPALDRLAADGVRFTQGYSTGRCWPSRASLMTGHYAQQVRMDPPKGRLPAWARVAPHYLQPEGYRCYHSGKWHVHGAPKPVADGGFDHSYVLHDHNRFFSPQKHWEDDQPLPPISIEDGYYATTAIADHALRCLEEHSERHSDSPFFHYLCFTSPHFPLHALQEDIDTYRDTYACGWDEVRQARWQRMREMGIVNCELSPLQPETIPGWNLAEEELREQIGPGEAAWAVPWDELTAEQRAFQATKMAIHAAMVDRMDREISRVMGQLRAMDAYENTVIMFVSDNGASAEQIIRGDMHDPSAPPGSSRSFLCLGPGWSTASNTPLRLHKHWVHEGGIASPLIVHWPAGLPARGELRHTPCHFIDLLPTILDLAGIQPSPTWRGKPAPPLTGTSLAPALPSDTEVPHDFLFFHHSGNRAIRVGDWKLVAAGKQGPWELYDLCTDRCESHDLSEQHPDKARDLSALWERTEQEFRRMAASEEWPPGEAAE